MTSRLAQLAFTHLWVDASTRITLDRRLELGWYGDVIYEIQGVCRDVKGKCKGKSKGKDKGKGKCK